MQKWLLVLFLAFKIVAAISQSFTIENFSVEQGLPSSEVYEVFQDSKGFIWFATDNGVAKFDGQDFETFHVKDGLTDPVVFGFYEDSEKRIWFRTFSGKLCYYEKGKIIKYKHNAEIITRVRGDHGYISFAYDNTKKNLWFSVFDRIGKIDEEGNVEIKQINGEAIYFKEINGEHHLLGNSTVWGVPTSIMINDKVFSITLSDTTYQNKVLRAIYWKDKLLISLYNDIFLYNGESLRRSFSSSKPIISLSKDNQDNLWVGYLNGGADRFSEETFTTTWHPEFMDKKSITKVMSDIETGLWFSTLESGVYYIPNLLIKHYPFPGTSKIRCVQRFNNSILIGDNAGLVYSISQTEKKFKPVKSLPAPVLSFFSNEKNRLWISSTSGLYIYDSVFTEKKFYSRAVVDFAPDYNGFIWSYGGNRFVKYTKDGDLLTELHIPVVYRAIHFEDSLMWLAGRTGLHIYDETILSQNTATKRFKELAISHIQKFNDSTYNHLLSKNVVKSFEQFKITDIQRFNDSTLLITTVGSGFLLLNKKDTTYKKFDIDDKFIANNVYSVIKSDSLIWFGTEKGVVVANTKSLLDEAPSFELLTKKSGLLGDKVNFLTYANNSIWAFFDKGFSVIPISQKRSINQNPIFYVKNFLVNNKPVERFGDVDLPFDQGNVEIEYGYISYNNRNFLIRYRLSDSEDWILTSNQKLQFSSLAAQKYNFELQYSTDNVHWIPSEISIAFTIHPPWWKTWYYQLIIVLIIASIIYFYFRNRVALTQQRQKYLEIINEHQQKLLQTEIQTTERERSRIAKDLHDSVGTNLAALKMIIGQLLQKHHEPLADHIENQMQGVIHETKEIIYNLAPPGAERYGLFVLLKNQIEKINRVTSTVINFTASGDDVQEPSLKLVILRVLQELISNSLKHAHAKNINIYISTFEDRINIIFEDDGIGFSIDQKNNGFGLHNVESRIESLDGQVKFESGQYGISYDIDIPLVKN